MRKSPVYYIAPSTISITPNANGSFNDLAVYVAKGCKVKVYSPKAGIGYVGGTAQEWEMTGRNRRLAESDKPYTIYVRLPKRSKKSGYLVFAAKEYAGGQWHDAYPYITTDGETAANASGNWYVRLGDVSLPENGLRTVTYDTGILGTEEFNTEWALNPDALPLRVELGCTIDDEDAGPTPYVFWGKTAMLSASLSEGWTGTVSERFDHWEITRDTGVAAADAQWNAVDRSATFGATGVIGLQHSRQAGDDFNGAVSTTFTVKAVGRADDGTDALVVLASESIVLLAETLEKYEIVLSTSFVSWNPMSDTYSPADGVRVNIRATDQRGDVVKITKGQMDTAGLTVAYQHAGSQSWTVLPFTNPSASVAEAVIPVAAFEAQLNVNVRILSQSGMEMHFVTIAFLRDGEDSRDREWIYLRSEQAITFGNAESEHPSPSLIPYGEVEPGNRAAGHVTDDKDQDGWVPEGWWDEMQGTDDTWHYEYAAYRDYIREDVTEGTPAHWGDFSKPVPWSYSAEDAVSYRCRWTLDGTEVWQLTASYTGAFQGTLPLVGTLMKRKGSDAEQAVTATSTVITIRCEGLTDTFVITSRNPQFTISPTENPEIIDKLNDKRLTGLSVTFAVDGGESFSYTIPVIREADEDSILRTMEERGGELFLSKRNDDTAGGFITFLKGLLSEGPATFRGLLTAVEAVITSIKSPNYTGDGIADTGFRLTADDGTGSSALTVDNLHVRKRAVFEELEVKKEMAVAGNEVKSCAANVIDRTDYYGDGDELLGYSERQVPWLLGKMPVMLRGLYARSKFFGRMRRIRVELDAEAAGRIKKVRCYFLANDGDREVKNLWRVGDLVRCQTINLVSSKRYIYINGGGQTATGNVYWWRKAVKAADTQGYSTVTIDGKEYHYFDVYCDYAQEQLGNYVNADTGSMIPCAGDHAVQFGNDRDPDRMNIIITEVNGADAPACKDYEGIYTFDLNKNWWQQGQQGESPLVYRRSPRAGVRIVSSKFELITRTSVAPVPVERGAWVSGFIYYYYDLVQHNGASWLCVASDGNRYQVVENIIQPGSPDIPEGTVLTQAQYDTLSVENKIKCTRSATGSTDLEPSEQNVSVWRPYAQKGSTGQSAFKSTMFCRMTATPAKPTHGSYDNPSPADSAGTDTDGAQVSWYDGIPDGVKQLWASTRIFTSDGQAPQQSVWNDPRKMTDTETYDVEFAKKQPNDAKPANPNGHNQHGGDQTQVWFDPTLDSSEDFTQMYWRAERSIINGVPGTWVVVRIKGEKGDDGTSPYFADIDNEMDSVACDPSGKTTSAYDAYIGVHVWHGSTEETLTKLQASSVTGLTITPDMNNKRIRVQVANNTQIDKVNTVTITVASAGSGDKTLHFVLNGVRAGANGNPAVLYSLVPSVSSVVKKKDGTYSVNNVSCTRQKNVGGTITNNTTDGTITYKLDGGSEQAYTNNTDIAVSRFTKSIQFIFKVGGVTVDVETIPMVVDGADSTVPGPPGQDSTVPGPPGADAWAVTASPSPLIINQNIDNASDFGLPIEINFTGKCGDNTATVGTVTAQNGMGLTITSGSGKITITAYKKVNNAYVTSGIIVCTVPVSYGTRSASVTFRISVGVNMIGQFSDEIKGDMRTELATSSLYKIENGVLVEEQNWGEFYRSSTENISRLTKQVNNGKNLLSGVLTAAGWKSGSYPTFNNDAIADDNGWINVKSGDSTLRCPTVTLTKGSYAISFEAEGSSGVAGAVCNASDNSIIYEITASGSGRKSATFALSSQSTALYIILSKNKIRYPQLEIGTAATAFDAGATEVSSEIKQTADDIILRAGQAGIKIDGDNRYIDLIAGKVYFKTSAGQTNPKISIDPSTGALKAVDGEFSGKVEVASTKGKWVIEPHTSAGAVPRISGQDGSGNEVMVIYFDSDLDDTTYVRDGGGLIFVDNQNGALASRFCRNAWRTNCHEYGKNDQHLTYIQSLAEETDPRIFIYQNAAGNAKSLTMGANTNGAYLLSSNWMSKANAVEGETYVDAWGNMKVKNSLSYDQFNVRTGSFQLPYGAPVSTVFFCKGLDSDMTVTTSGWDVIMNPDDRGTTQSMSFYDKSVFFVKMAQNTWVTFWSE